MSRRTPREKVYDEVLEHFDNKKNEMVYAINTELKKRGKEMVSRQAVDRWREIGVPPGNVIAVELATDGAITRQRIRPELYE